MPAPSTGGGAGASEASIPAPIAFASGGVIEPRRLARRENRCSRAVPIIPI